MSPSPPPPPLGLPVNALRTRDRERRKPRERESTFTEVQTKRTCVCGCVHVAPPFVPIFAHPAEHWPSQNPSLQYLLLHTPPPPNPSPPPLSHSPFTHPSFVAAPLPSRVGHNRVVWRGGRGTGRAVDPVCDLGALVAVPPLKTRTQEKLLKYMTIFFWQRSACLLRYLHSDSPPLTTLFLPPPPPPRFFTLLDSHHSWSFSAPPPPTITPRSPSA